MFSKQLIIFSAIASGLLANAAPVKQVEAREAAELDERFYYHHYAPEKRDVDLEERFYYHHYAPEKRDENIEERFYYHHYSPES
ncbi:hypothetical protein BDN71DRAFT_1452411 [Pleurotus eryngii]|uniref:Uncharacterized protein n=1 Tax=Pleurotus eryngii TaxID=5323 RepID=A0A9P5ZS61_PLEER|nr:hypothetical protein BDN71DRAFT_1452411 [Pleurotus eryngii]